MAVALLLGLTTTMAQGVAGLALPNKYLETNQKFAEAFGNPSIVTDPMGIVSQVTAANPLGGALSLKQWIPADATDAATSAASGLSAFTDPLLEVTKAQLKSIAKKRKLQQEFIEEMMELQLELQKEEEKAIAEQAAIMAKAAKA